MNDPERGGGDQKETAQRLLSVIRELVVELHPSRAAGLVVELDSALDRDLGLDSLSRVELLSRLEKAFRMRLPESVLSAAETPRDLLTAVLGGGAAAPLSTGTALRPLGRAGARGVPTSASTLVETLDWHATSHPERTHIVLYEEADREREISYGDLRDAALRVAAGLRDLGVAEGESVGIMLPTSAAFFEAFFGVLYADGVPVPIYPPFRPSQLEDHLRRQAAILDNAQARLLIAPEEARAIGGILSSRVESLRCVETVEGLRRDRVAVPVKRPAPEQTALIQYTSGSTGDPKGVVLSHANLLANIRCMGRVMQAGPSDVFVSWLPLYHDMGLIGAWLGSLYHAAPVVILSPLRFLSRPESWLWAIHRHGATLSASPNFGYELCLRKIADEDIEGLDLSSWRMALNGAEPVSPSTLRRFAERFRAYGFAPEAMAPVYGLAESSVGLAFPPPGRGPVIDRVDRKALTTHGEARVAPPDAAGAVEFVACGRPLPGHQLRVVDDAGRELSDRREGRLQFQGPSCTRGYFRSPEKTRALFDGPWLESGDLAYVSRGEVYLTGRTKDIIIRAGRNVHPHEIEEAVGNLPGVRKGCVAVFPSLDPRSQVERLIVLAETRETDPVELSRLRKRIEEDTTALVEMPPDDVVLAPPHSVLKTSSGKVRRAACRARYEQGEIGAQSGPVWRQVVRLEGATLVQGLRRSVQRALELAYAAWWWAATGLCAATAWVGTMLIPSRRGRWWVVRHLARAMFHLTGTRLRVEGLENLPEGGAMLVVNHSSYLDAWVLAATIPGEPCFVAKRELADQRFAGPLLRRLGSLFVERFDLQGGVEDTQRMLEAARAGERIICFPEGTLLRMPGLLPFKLGAFRVAAQAGLPVAPIALRGTRSMLRADQWFPRRGSLQMQVGKAIAPRGADWGAAVDLRNRSRAELLWMVGEPDLREAPLS